MPAQRVARGTSISEPAQDVADIGVLVLAAFYRFSRLGCGFLSFLLATATLQALIVTLATGGSLQEMQTISASVSNWDTPQGRFFFALCTFGAVLNVVTLQTFFLTPPAAHPPGKCARGCVWTCTIITTCSKPNQRVHLWPMGAEGFIRFWWLALQSFGLYLLASVNYKASAEPHARIEDALHNSGAALAFVVSFTLEVLTLSAFPMNKFVGRRVFTGLGITFAVFFIVTQVALQCVGFAPPDVCKPPWGIVSYVLEMCMCFSLAAVFFFTAREMDERFFATSFIVMQTESNKQLLTQAEPSQAQTAVRSDRGNLLWSAAHRDTASKPALDLRSRWDLPAADVPDVVRVEPTGTAPVASPAPAATPGPAAAV